MFFCKKKPQLWESDPAEVTQRCYTLLAYLAVLPEEVDDVTVQKAVARALMFGLIDQYRG